MDKIYTVEQVADILQIHHFTVLSYIRAGKIKAAQLGRVYRIRQSDLDEFLNDCIFMPSPSQKAQTKKVTARRGRPRKEISIPLEK